MTAQKTFTLTGNAGASNDTERGSRTVRGVVLRHDRRGAGYWMRGSDYVYLAGG